MSRVKDSKRKRPTRKGEGAPKGNEFWKLRAKHGRDKLFASPVLLLEAASEYFAWCDANPWKREELKVVGKAVERHTVNLGRPYTFAGLCNYCGCSINYFNHFLAEERKDKEDFKRVIECIRQTMYQQKFEGASIGVFNANIIARDLGLVDKAEVKSENTHVNITPTAEEAKRIRKALEKNI